MCAILTKFSKICICVSKRRVWLMCFCFFLPPTLRALGSLSGSVCVCWSAFPHLLNISSQMLCPSEHMTVLSPGSIPPGSFNLGRKDFHLKLDFGKHQSPCCSPHCPSGDAVTRLWIHIERGENKAGFPSFCFFFQGSRQVFHHFTGLSARASGWCTRQNCAESWSFYEGIWWFWWRRPKPAGEVRAHQTSSTTAVLRVFLCHNWWREGEDVTFRCCKGFVKIIRNFILIIFSNWKYLSCLEVMK